MRLTKHHGLGNDFLVVLEAENPRLRRIDGRLARRVCDRATGVGADGLIHGAVSDDDTDVRMHLYNADGSRAEISGNGLRCLAQALVFSRGQAEGSCTIATDAGIRSAEVIRATGRHSSAVTVEMGVAGDGPDVPLDVERRAPGAFATVDLGNPHLVLVVDDVDDIDLAQAGPAFEAPFGGINVEFIAPVDRRALRMRVWERGVGITQACGSGACAAAHAAHEWGLVGTDVTVHMPGGDAKVELGDMVRLTGPAVHVATLEYFGG
jgi:diaminopimelate epimerase